MADDVPPDPYNFTYDPFKNDSIIGQLDPFIGTNTQTNRMRAFCKVMVNGVDITDRIYPHLISVLTHDESPDPSCEIEIDDRDGTMPLPPLGAPIAIAFGWQTESMVSVFKGVVDSFEHGFGRKSGGRRMWVHGRGLSHYHTAAKEPMQDMLGDGAPPGKQEGDMHGLDKWLNQISKNANVFPRINAALANIKQDFWTLAGSSPMHELTSLADQFGFMHQFTEGNKLTVELVGERGLSCHAIWRDNLIAWRVRPLSVRSAFKGGKQQWYSNLEGHWNFAAQQFGLKFPFGAAKADVQPQKPAATETGAGNDNKGAQEESNAGAFGNGTIVINGEPAATWNSEVLLVGARPGVDGIYNILAVDHTYSRQGFITTLKVRPKVNAAESSNVTRGFLDLPRPQPNIG